MPKDVAALLSGPLHLPADNDSSIRKSVTVKPNHFLSSLIYSPRVLCLTTLAQFPLPKRKAMFLVPEFLPLQLKATYLGE
jgi:hypothetical protein